MRRISTVLLLVGFALNPLISNADNRILGVIPNGAASGKYSKETGSLFAYSAEYMEQVGRTVQGLAHIRVAFERLDRQLKRTLAARKKITENGLESCQPVYADKDKLNECLARQEFAIEQLQDEVELAGEVTAWAQKEIPLSYRVMVPKNTPEADIEKIVAKQSQEDLKNLEEVKVSIGKMKTGVVDILRTRLSEGKTQFANLYKEEATKKYQASVAAYDEYIAASGLVSDLYVAANVFKEKTERALSANRYLKGMNQLAAMEWMATQFEHLPKGLSEKTQKSASFKDSFEKAQKVFAKSVAETKLLLEKASANREDMLDARLPAAFKEVENAKILRADRERMIAMLSASRSALGEYKKAREFEKLRYAETLMEQVGAWLEGGL